MPGTDGPVETGSQPPGVAERRSPERLRMEQNQRIHLDWLSSLDYRVNNEQLKPDERLTPEQRNKIIAFALLRRERRLKSEQGKTEEERKKYELDPMTGLNRQEHLRPEIERRIAERESFAILFTDLDHFGDINKEYGQPAGDEVIAEAALRLQDGLRGDVNDERGEDKAYRNGGDETAIILPSVTSQEQLSKIAERTRIAMESAPFHIPLKDKEITLTVSIGGIIWNGNEDMEHFMVRAGDALQQAKTERNVVTIQ